MNKRELCLPFFFGVSLFTKRPLIFKKTFFKGTDMEEMTKDTPSLLDSDDMINKAEDVLNFVPQADIKGMHTPEELAESRNIFWKAYLSENKLEESNFNINSFLKNYIQQNRSADVSKIAAALPEEKAGLFYKQHLDKLEDKINDITGKLRAEGSAVAEAEPPKAFSVDDLTNDLAKDLASGDDEVDKVITAAESANDKFDTIRAVARTILQGKGIKHHGFIFGDPGCGKCVSYKEKIPIRIDGVESVAEVGALYDKAVAAGAKPFKEGDGEFAEVPFDLQIKDENGRWIYSTMVYRKEDAIYEVEFEKDGKIKTGKYAAEHILPYDFKAQLSTYVKNLQVGDKLPSGHIVKSVKKVADKDFVYSPQADSETHCYQDIDGLIHHNTFSVKEAIKYDFPNGALSKKGWSIEFNAGDIGRSASAIVAFFYKNKNKKIIILDDCDSFLLSKDQAIQNLLKGMLDLDNTEKNPKYITVAPQIRKLASKIIKADNASMEEGVEIEINQKALREGRLAVSINGEEVLNEAADPEDLKMFKLVETKKPVREHTDYSGLGLMYESVDDEDDADEWDNISDDDAEIAAQFAELEGASDDGEIPPKWRFASRLIMISNLRKSDLNDAVLSRTLSYELSLTQEEFMARLAQILPHMLTDVETEDSVEVVEYAKKAAYAYLLAAVELASKGGSVGGKPVRIVGKLQFRIIAELAGKWMQRADDYAVKHNIENIDRLALDTINNAIKRNFFIFDVMPSLITD